MADVCLQRHVGQGQGRGGRGLCGAANSTSVPGPALHLRGLGGGQSPRVPPPDPQEDSDLNSPGGLQERGTVRRNPSGVLVRASLGCLGPRDGIEKSGRWRRREQRWKTTTPIKLWVGDACVLRARCPCGPRAGSAAPLRCGGGHGGTFPGLDPGPGRAAPAPSVPRPRPHPDAHSQPGLGADSGSHSGTCPRSSCSPSRERWDRGARGRKWGYRERGGSGSTWPEPAAARQPEEGASPGTAARQEAGEARGLLGLQGGGGAWAGAGLGAS